MNLREALNAAESGSFVTNEYFDNDQSLHYYNGKFYYEDGAVITERFLQSEDFAVNGRWSVIATKEHVNQTVLKKMHEAHSGYSLIHGSYADCIQM